MHSSGSGGGARPRTVAPTGASTSEGSGERSSGNSSGQGQDPTGSPSTPAVRTAVFTVALANRPSDLAAGEHEIVEMLMKQFSLSETLIVFESNSEAVTIRFYIVGSSSEAQAAVQALDKAASGDKKEAERLGFSSIVSADSPPVPEEKKGRSPAAIPVGVIAVSVVGCAVLVASIAAAVVMIRKVQGRRRDAVMGAFLRDGAFHQELGAKKGDITTALLLQYV